MLWFVFVGILSTDIGWLAQRADWAGLAAVGAVKSTVFEKGVARVETRYFITSFAEAVRGHWSIENQLHWRLDVTFGEDSARTSKDNAPLNWNVMRKTALPLLRNAKTGKNTSIKRKMFMAALDVGILERILLKSKCVCPALLDASPHVCHNSSVGLKYAHQRSLLSFSLRIQLPQITKRNTDRRARL